jgi:hypothetical protein
VSPAPADPRHALLLVTGALVAIVGSGRARETDQVTFTDAFAELGTIGIADILDIADAALAPKPDHITGVDL